MRDRAAATRKLKPQGTNRRPESPNGSQTSHNRSKRTDGTTHEEPQDVFVKCRNRNGGFDLYRRTEVGKKVDLPTAETTKATSKTSKERVLQLVLQFSHQWEDIHAWIRKEKVESDQG